MDDSGRIINAFKVMQAELHLDIHFEYVPSEQNLADLPSRGAFEKMFQVIRAATGKDLVRGKNLHYHDFVLPSFESWRSPLSMSTMTRKRRSGSRGAKRKKALHDASVLAESES